MMRVSRPNVLAALAGLFALAAAAAPCPANDVVQSIPHDALGFVVLNRIGEIDAKIAEVGRLLQLPIPNLSTLKAKAGLTEGLDEKGGAAVVALPRKDGAVPAVLLYLPVTDFRKFIAPLAPDDPSAKVVNVQVMNRPAVAASRPGFAVIARQRDRETLEEAIGASKNVAGQLPSLGPWLNEQDVSAVATRAGVQLLSAKAKDGLKTFQKVMEATGGADAQRNPAIVGLEMYRTMFEAAEKIVTNAAIGIRLDDQGSVCLTKRVHFMPDSRIAAALGKLGQAKKHPLAGLPAGPFLFAGGGVISAELADVWMDLSAAMMKSTRGMYGLDEKTVDQVTSAARPMMKRFGGMSFAMGVGKEGEPLYSRMFAVMAVDDSESYLRQYEEYVQQFRKATEAAGSPFSMTLATEPAEIDGQSALVLVFDMPLLSGKGAGAAQFGQLTEKMFGPGGKVRAYVAAADQSTVVMGYTSPDALRQVLAAAKGSKPQLMDDPMVAKTGKMLPLNAPAAGFWNVAGTLAFANRLAAAMGPEKKSNVRLPAFPAAPPIGFAVEGRPGELHGTMVVPAQLLQAIGTYVKQTRKASKNAPSP